MTIHQDDVLGLVINLHLELNLPATQEQPDTSGQQTTGE
jgi:hypothetical protein